MRQGSNPGQVAMSRSALGHYFGAMIFEEEVGPGADIPSGKFASASTRAGERWL